MEKTKFREQLREYSEARLGTSFDSLTDVQRSKEMTRFYVDRVLRIIDPGMVPDDEYDLDAALVDGKDDYGVDYVFRNQNRVLLIQSKYHKHGFVEPQESFSHFCDVLLRLHSRKAKMNSKLREATNDFDWVADWFDLHFLSVATFGEPLRKRSEQGISPLPGVRLIEDRTELSALSESDLNVRLREALSAGETSDEVISVRFTPVGEQSPYLTYEPANGRFSFLGFIGGSQLAEMYRPNKYRLFALNIRDYVGDTSTNKAIVDTATNRPEDFFFFNNGVSAIATSIEPSPEDENILLCKRFSIINGAQTVRSLWKAQEKNPQSVRNVQVLLRISSFSLGKDPDFIQDVTRYNNTQNSIKISDFRSNDPVQKALQRAFGDLPSRGGKPFWYKSKRSAERSTTKVPISMEEFAKTIHSFRFGPDDMFGGTGYLFDTNTSGGYAKIFGDGENVWTGLTQDDFHLLAGSWFVCEQMRAEWKSQKEARMATASSDDVKNALERRWMVFWTCGELLRLIYKERSEDLDSALRRLYKPTWINSKGQLADALKRIVELACQALIVVYQRAASRSDFSHRNWFRSQATLSEIRGELSNILTYAGIGSLPRLDQRGDNS